MNHSLSDATLSTENRGCKWHFLRLQGTQRPWEKNIYINEAREACIMNGGNVEEVVVNYWSGGLIWLFWGETKSWLCLKVQRPEVGCRVWVFICSLKLTESKVDRWDGERQSKVVGKSEIMKGLIIKTWLLLCASVDSVLCQLKSMGSWSLSSTQRAICQ